MAGKAFPNISAYEKVIKSNYTHGYVPPTWVTAGTLTTTTTTTQRCDEDLDYFSGPVVFDNRRSTHH